MEEEGLRLPTENAAVEVCSEAALAANMAAALGKAGRAEEAQDLTTVASPPIEPLLPPTVDASYGAAAYRWPGQVVPSATAGSFPPAQVPTIVPDAPMPTAATSMGEAPFRTTPIPAPPQPGFLSEQMKKETKVAEAPQGSAPVSEAPSGSAPVKWKRSPA